MAGREGAGAALECPVCLDQFTDATTLGCGHTFCGACLLRQLRLDEPAAAVCAICREPVRAAQPAFVVRNITQSSPPHRTREVDAQIARAVAAAADAGQWGGSWRRLWGRASPAGAGGAGAGAQDADDGASEAARWGRPPFRPSTLFGGVSSAHAAVGFLVALYLQTGFWLPREVLGMADDVAIVACVVVILCYGLGDPRRAAAA